MTSLTLFSVNKNHRHFCCNWCLRNEAFDRKHFSVAKQFEFSFRLGSKHHENLVDCVVFSFQIFQRMNQCLCFSFSSRFLSKPLDILRVSLAKNKNVFQTIMAKKFCFSLKSRRSNHIARKGFNRKKTMLQKICRFLRITVL